MCVCVCVCVCITKNMKTEKISKTKSAGHVALMGGMTLVRVVPISRFQISTGTDKPEFHSCLS